MPLDVLVFDLLVPSDAPAAMREMRLPALEKWLARAAIAREERRPGADWLALKFGLCPPVPVAAIALAGEATSATATGCAKLTALPDEGWLRADPVHLRIDGGSLALHDAAILELTRAEADALVAALQSHFGADGLAFHAPSPDRWYVRVARSLLPRTVPLAEALRRNVFGLLPQNAPSAVPNAGINWRSAITEAQMILAAHEVNAQREAAGAPAANSVWFWGEGELPAKLTAPYGAIYADEVFARGLGKLSGSAVHALPRHLDEIPQSRAGAATLAVVDTLSLALHRGDAIAWQARAKELERAYFAALGKAIARFGSVRVILPTANDTRIATLGTASRWRWFRARRPLAHHA